MCGFALLDLVPDGLHQVGLAHADATVQEQRVVGLGRSFRDCARGGMRELVARADDESVEGVLGIQLRRAVPVEALLADRTRGSVIRRTDGFGRQLRASRLAGAVRSCSARFSSSVTNSTSWYSRPRFSMASLIRSPYFSPMWQKSGFGTLHEQASVPASD